MRKTVNTPVGTVTDRAPEADCPASSVMTQVQVMSVNPKIALPRTNLDFAYLFIYF